MGGCGGVVVQAQGERDSFACGVDVEHFDLDDVAGFDHVAGIFDEFVRHR